LAFTFNIITKLYALNVLTKLGPTRVHEWRPFIDEWPVFRPFSRVS